jgi:hypothetical protein
VDKSLGPFGLGPVVLVHTQKVGIKYKKPLSLTSKKTDFWQSSQTIIRRFDSCHLSQPLLPLAWLTKRPEKGREIPTFRAFGLPKLRGEIAESLRLCVLKTSFRFYLVPESAKLAR